VGEDADYSGAIVALLRAPNRLWDELQVPPARRPATAVTPVVNERMVRYPATAATPVVNERMVRYPATAATPVVN
jgi:hypothetical protein